MTARQFLWINYRVKVDNQALRVGALIRSRYFSRGLRDSKILFFFFFGAMAPRCQASVARSSCKKKTNSENLSLEQP